MLKATATTRFTLPAAAGTLLLAACASAPVMEGHMPAPLGSSWEMAQRNTGSYGKDAQLTITRRTTTWKGAPAIALVNSQGMTIVQEPDSGHFMAVVGPSGQPVVSYDPPVGWQWPLKVGKRWEGRQRMTVHATGRTLEYEYTCQVADFEKVTVPAGTYDAFRIECASTIGSNETYWTSPQVGGFLKMSLRREANSPFGAGTQHAEMVRAPR